MARHESDFRPAGEEPLGQEEFCALLAEQKVAASRKEAIACYLSASEGWQSAGETLCGAFAELARLRERKGG